jgi:hypothetical protein
MSELAFCKTEKSGEMPSRGGETEKGFVVSTKAVCLVSPHRISRSIFSRTSQLVFEIAMPVTAKTYFLVTMLLKIFWRFMKLSPFSPMERRNMGRHSSDMVQTKVEIASDLFVLNFPFFPTIDGEIARSRLSFV